MITNKPPNVTLLSSLPIILFLLLGSACTPTQAEKTQFTETVQSAGQRERDCRRSVAAKPEYQIIAKHMPLDDVNQATLTQMIDVNLSNSTEDLALDRWQRDMRACADQLIGMLRNTTPVLIPIIVTAWNKEDETLVLLVHRKIAWGDAVMRLKTQSADADRAEPQSQVHRHLDGPNTLTCGDKKIFDAMVRRAFTSGASLIFGSALPRISRMNGILFVGIGVAGAHLLAAEAPGWPPTV